MSIVKIVVCGNHPNLAREVQDLIDEHGAVDDHGQPTWRIDYEFTPASEVAFEAFTAMVVFP